MSSQKKTDLSNNKFLKVMMININSISRAENLYLYPGSRKPKINPTNDRKQYKINSSDTLSLNCGQ